MFFKIMIPKNNLIFRECEIEVSSSEFFVVILHKKKSPLA